MRRQLLDWLQDDIAPEIRAGADPADAILKFAEERDLSVAQVEGLGQLFNTAKTIAHLEKSANRGDSFGIVDVPALLDRFIDNAPKPKSASATIPMEFDNVDGGMELPDCFNDVNTLQPLRLEAVSPAQVQANLEKRAHIARADVLLMAEMTRDVQEHYRHELMEKIAKIVDHFVDPDNDHPFSEFEANALAIHGDEAKPMLDKIATAAKNRRFTVKRASGPSEHRLVRDKNKLLVKFDEVMDFRFKMAAADELLKEAGESLSQREGLTGADVDPKELATGTKMEHHEHGLSKSKAKQTALDHLAENPKYYTALKEVEQKSEAKKAAAKFPGKKEVLIINSTGRPLDMDAIKKELAEAFGPGQHREESSGIKAIIDKHLQAAPGDPPLPDYQEGDQYPKIRSFATRQELIEYALANRQDPSKIPTLAVRNPQEIALKGGEPVKHGPISEALPQPKPRPSTIKKDIANIADTMSETADTQFKSIVNRFKGMPVTPEAGQDFVDDQLNNLKQLTMLQRLMASDEVLSEADPDRVLEAFETIRRAMPTLASDPNIMRIALRSAVAHEGISHFDVKGFMDAEQTAKRLNEPSAPASAKPQQGNKSLIGALI